MDINTAGMKNTVARAGSAAHGEAPRLDQLVVVQGEWNGWRTAVVHAVDLESPHWLQPAGAPRPLLHAYVPCTAIVSGEVAHDCGSAPHRLHVCVLKKHTAPAMFETLARMADTQATAATAPWQMFAVPPTLHPRR
jgi:hypothetical protein